MTRGGRHTDVHALGRDVVAGERPQVIVPAFHWQTTRTLGKWSLVGCTVAPGYTLETTSRARMRR